MLPETKTTTQYDQYLGGKIQPILARRQLVSGTTSYLNDNCSANNSLQYDINTRQFLSPFLTSSGYEKVTGFIISLNIEGTAMLKRTFYNHQPVVIRDVIKVTTAVIKEAQQAEIKATILEHLKEKYLR